MPYTGPTGFALVEAVSGKEAIETANVHLQRFYCIKCGGKPEYTTVEAAAVFAVKPDLISQIAMDEVYPAPAHLAEMFDFKAVKMDAQERKKASSMAADV
jgi:hypothetical protein